MSGRDPASQVCGVDEDAVGQLPAGILCTVLRPPPGVGSKDQTEREGSTEAGAGGVMGSTRTRAKSHVADRVLVLWPVVRPETEVGESSSGHWSTRDLPFPHNINQQELPQRSPSQH